MIIVTFIIEVLYYTVITLFFTFLVFYMLGCIPWTAPLIEKLLQFLFERRKPEKTDIGKDFDRELRSRK